MRGNGLERLGHLPHEVLVVLLIGPNRPLPEMARVVRIILPDLHMHPGCTGEIETRIGVTQDLVEVRRHPPSLPVPIEHLESKGGATQDVCVERVSAETVGQGVGGETGCLGQGSPRPQLAPDLDQVGGVVAGDQVVELADLVGQGGRSPRTRRRRHPVSFSRVVVT